MTWPVGSVLPSTWYIEQLEVTTDDFRSSPDSLGSTQNGTPVFVKFPSGANPAIPANTPTGIWVKTTDPAPTIEIKVEDADQNPVSTVYNNSSSVLADWTFIAVTPVPSFPYRVRIDVTGKSSTVRAFFDDLNVVSEVVDGAVDVSGLITGYYTPLEVVSGAITASGGVTSTQVFTEAVSGAVTVSGGAASAMIFVEQVGGSIVVSGDISALATFFEQVRGAITVGGNIKVVEAVLTAWCVNAETSGSTRYENFNFNSFAKIGSSYYGCKADGIYAFDGDDDAGTPIQAMVSFGKQDFGTTALKRVTNLYLGASSTGKLYVKVLAEGEEYLYAARDYSEHIQTQRVDLGRGLRANYLEFELYNADGDDFELASVEFVAVPLTRRI